MNKTVLDSGFYAVDSEYRYWIPAPFSEELRFRIPTSCSQFTNWGVKKLIASCFTEIFFLFFFFWKLRHRITADSNDCFPLAGTHFPTGNSGVVYIFYGLWALSSTEIRLGVIVFPLCEVSGGAKIERFNKNFLFNLAMPLWASVEETGLWEWAAKTTRVARGTYEICPCLMWRVKAETCIFYWLVFPWIGRNNFNLLLFA